MVVKAQGEFVWHKHDDTDDPRSATAQREDPARLNEPRTC
jgi:hypothetical protein